MPAVVGLLILFTTGCRRPAAPPPPPPPPPALGTIDVQLAVTEDGARPPVDVPALRAAVSERLLATRLFSPPSSSPSAAGGAAPPARADVVIRVGGETAEVGAAGEARARVALTIECRPADAAGAFAVALDGAGTQRYVARSKRGGDAATAAETALAVRIAGDLVDGFVARRQLHDGPPSAVHAALSADGGELREEAIHAAGERQLRNEAPLLLKLLDDPDERTRDAALGALIALGDRRAVTALTRSRSLRDRREMRKIIEAVSILGGEEADDYLSFVAASHDDDDIRAAAAAARERMLRRPGMGGNPAR
ncbi:MAG: HEAT repeat domain-containing protein [Pseudomonadota bacterium]